MRILVLTDTHGDIDVINTLIERTRPDLCIHCGDFGFYDDKSVERLTVRELRLRWKHSDLPKSLRKKAFTMDPDTLRHAVAEEGLLSTFQPYLDGDKRFAAPVYAVWGNHEDHEVVRGLASGELAVDNLVLLDGRQDVELPEGVRLFGLGGNFYYEGAEELFASGMTGDGGKVRASWTQHARLLDRMVNAPNARWPLLVTHVSPGKARLLERLALVGGARFAFSGHMGPPIHHTWSLFSICEPQEVMARSQEEFETLSAMWASFEGKGEMAAEDVELVESSIARLDLEPLPPPERGRRAEPGSVEERYRTTHFVNLSDVVNGWGVVEIDGWSARWTGESD